MNQDAFFDPEIPEEDIPELEIYDYWWDNDYQPITKAEVCWDAGCTSDELEEALAEMQEQVPDYAFNTFLAYIGNHDLSDKFQTVMLWEDNKGEPFLAIQDSIGRLTDVTEDIFLELGYADYELGKYND